MNSPKALFLEIPGNGFKYCILKDINKTNWPIHIINPDKNALNGKLSRIKHRKTTCITPIITKNRQNISINFNFGYLSSASQYDFIDTL